MKEVRPVAKASGVFFYKWAVGDEGQAHRMSRLLSLDEQGEDGKIGRRSKKEKFLMGFRENSIMNWIAKSKGALRTVRRRLHPG